MGGVNVLKVGVSSSTSLDPGDGSFPKFPDRGEKIREPQAGSSSGFGETLIAPRSYEFGEWVEKVAVKPGDEGKCT